MKLNRKWILVASLLLSVVMATSGTLAYMTATASKTNTFTVGNVAITLDEPSWEDKSLIGPGVTVAKDPTITNTGRTAAYVWLTVDVPNSVYDYISFDTLGAGWTNAGATKGEDVTTVVFKYNNNEDNKLASNATTTAAFSSVTLAKEIPEDVFDALAATFDMVVKAYAIEATFDSFDDAYNAYGSETGDGPADSGDDDSKKYEAPTDAYRVTNSDELKQAILDGKTDILLAAGEYNWSGTGKQGVNPLYKLNLYGESKDAVIYMTAEGGEGADYDFDCYDVTFTGLTISSDEANGNWTSGWARMSATYNDCVINNTYMTYEGTHVFNYCTLNDTGNSYNIWTWGADNVTFDHCTFNCEGKSIYMDGNSGTLTKLTINSCVFNDNGDNSVVDNKAAVETGKTYGSKYELIVNETQVNGYAINPEGTSTNSTLWANKHSLTTDQLNVVVDGVDVY